MGWMLVFDSTGWRVLVGSWLGLRCFLGCDYLWRHEKHINRKVYILRGGGSGLFLGYLFFGDRLVGL